MVALADVGLELGEGDAEVSGVLGAANVGALLDAAVVPLDEVHAASPMPSAIIPVRAASFPMVPLGTPRRPRRTGVVEPAHGG